MNSEWKFILCTGDFSSYTMSYFTNNNNICIHMHLKWLFTWVSFYLQDWQWNCGSASIVLAWIMLVFFIQKFPKLGIYVVMFRYILYTFFKFFIVFLLFIIAFGLGFFCLLQNQVNTHYSQSSFLLISSWFLFILF